MKGQAEIGGGVAGKECAEIDESGSRPQQELIPEIPSNRFYWVAWKEHPGGFYVNFAYHQFIELNFVE